MRQKCVSGQHMCLDAQLNNILGNIFIYQIEWQVVGILLSSADFVCENIFIMVWTV